MIGDLEDERIAILRFALDKLRRYCSIANRNMNGASQGTVIRITEAGIINLKSQIVDLKYTWGCMVLTA